MPNMFLANLKRQAEENPMLAVGLGIPATQLVTKIAKLYIENKNSNAWKKEVKRRQQKTSNKK